MIRLALIIALVGLLLAGCGTSPSSALALERALVLGKQASDFVADENRQRHSAGFRGLDVTEFEYFFYGLTLDDRTHLRYEVVLPKPIEGESPSREVLVSAYSAPPFARSAHYLLRSDGDEWRLVERSSCLKVLRGSVRDSNLIRFIESNWGQFVGTLVTN
jgi:hypothetical protein